MVRNQRHEAILSLIEEQEIETQGELCEALARQGYAVTQATVSRDVKELHLFKVRGTQKRFRYACAVRQEGALSEKHRELFRASALNIRPVGNLVIVKTLPGSASNAGVAVDELAFREVAGSIAGDDTLLLICENAEDGKTVAERLSAAIKG